MRMKKICALLMISFLSISLLSTTVSAEDGTVYYRPTDTPGHFYNMTLNSKKASDTTWGQDNYLSLSSNVYYLDASPGQNGVTQIEIFVSGTGYAEGEYDPDDDPTGYPDDHVYNPDKLQLYAKQGDNVPHNASIDIHTSKNAGTNTAGDKNKGDETPYPMANTVQASAGFIPLVGEMQGIADLGTALKKDLDNNKVLKSDDGSEGPNARIKQNWDIVRENYDFCWHESNEDDMGYNEGTYFTFGTKILWEIPKEFKETTELVIGAKIRMEHTHGYPSETDHKWGASNEVSLKIKNGEISPSIESTNENSGTGSEYNEYEYHTSDFDYTDHIYPEFKIHANSPNNPDVHLQIDWKHGGDDYDTTDQWLKADEFPLTLDHSYYVGDDDVYNTNWSIEFDLSVPDYQGGWEYHETVYINGIKEEDDGGGGGGGGCPYISPWNGTKYKRENNLLMDAEFEEGEVTDKYLLENGLQSKNGNYHMKIEEFENSNDFFDQVQLYTLDHTEDTEIGLTPDEELVSYSKEDLIEPDSATLNGGSILEEVEEKDDEKRAMVENNDTTYLEFGDVEDYRWTQSKLVITASGFESYTESEYSTNAWIKSHRSLHFSVRVGEGDWTKVDVVHPRNNPSDYVIPLKGAIQENGFSYFQEDTSLQVRVNSTADHNIDRIAIDDTNPRPLMKKKADLESAVMKHSKVKTDVTSTLKEDDHRSANIVPGEEIKLEFSTPEKTFGRIFSERDFLLVSNGNYCRYEG